MIQEHVLDKKQNHDSIDDDRFLHITNVHLKQLGTISSTFNTIREKPTLNETLPIENHAFM